MPFVPNISDAYIKRPDPKDIGNEKKHIVLHDKLDIFFEENSELISDREGSTHVVTGIMLLPARDRRYDVVDAQANDVIVFNDYRGVEQKRTVIRATPEFDHLKRLDHIVVEVD